MLRSLHGKLALLLLLVYSASTAVYLLASLHAFETHQQEIVQKYHRALAERLVLQSRSGTDLNLETLFQNCLDQKRIHMELDFYLLDAHGAILRSTTATAALRRPRVDLRPIREFLGKTPMLPIRGDDPSMQRHRTVFSAAPLNLPEGGYLYIVLSGPEYASILSMGRDSYTLRISLWYGLGGLLLALTTGFLAFMFTTRRIVTLSGKMAAFRRDSLTSVDNEMPAGPKGDEIEDLEAAFSDLTRRIETQMEALRQVDSYRKDLIANVSHDLRTPITTLQGYLETILLRGPGMSPQEQRECVEIAFRQGERLSKLIADLFELSKLDSSAPPLNIEPFSVAELVQDIAQKFSLKARQSGVELRTDFPFDIPVVLGDIRLIERVLENLIENALRHTPAGGHVTLRLAGRNGSVLVSVSDSGNGIPQTELAHIFDRYYRASGKRGDGAGLGLAIAKRVVELHGGHLAAASTLGQGSTFFFDLPTRSSPANAG